MSLAVPPALKAADISRFAHRAGQLEKARPAVAYWCNYWMVEQIIAKGLHQADDDSKSYTMRLMDKLEQTKLDFSENNAITDDMAGHAYIEQFGQETFSRADNVMKANKVTKQTADTFLAAGTFLELCQIWGPLDPEIASKIKFAKYHALRIAKAIKAGEDPNDGNPKIETTADTENSAPLTGEVDNQTQPEVMPGRQPFVEDEADQVNHADLYSPPIVPTGKVEEYYQAAPPADVSPLAPSDHEGKTSANDGYFGDAYTKAPSNEVSPVEPSPMVRGSPSLPSSGSKALPTGTLSPNHVSTFAAPEPAAQTFVTPTPPPVSRDPLPRDTFRNVHPAAPPLPPASSVPLQSTASTTNFRDDEGSVMAAQKHARFAISALNFEDVPTAVKQLREALASLGASP